MNKAFGNLQYIGLTLLIFVFTFPQFAPNYGAGLDDSYVWGLSWLFENDYNTLLQLVYPIGPLGFLKHYTTIGNCLMWSIIFTSIVRLLFIASLFRLSWHFFRTAIVPTIIIFGMLACRTNIDYPIIFSCLVLCLLNQKENNFGYYIIATILAIIGLFVKSSIGIASLSIILVNNIITISKYQNIKNYILEYLVPLPIVFLIIGLSIFRDIELLNNFLIGTARLVIGYGGSLSLKPYNNWKVLTIFLITLTAIPFVLREKYCRIAFALSIIPFIASWKHGMVREDVYHYKVLIGFVCLLWGTMFLCQSQRRFITIVLATINIWAICYNYKSLPMYKELRLMDYGLKNIGTAVFDYKNLIAHSDSLTNEATQNCKLPDSTLRKIGNQTIDFYPCDYIYAAVNELNWQPRATLGTSISPQLMDLGAEKYSRDSSAVDFVFWKLNNDPQHREITYDHRHFLNDEPKAVFNILNNYDIVEQTDSYLLMRKNDSPLFDSIYCDTPFKSHYNKWIDIPKSDNEILRLKMQTRTNLLGSLKKMFYKDEIYYIDYQTSAGDISTYRIILSAATEGLWIAPTICHPEQNTIENEITKIRFRNTCNACVANDIDLQMEHIAISPTKNIFGKTQTSSHKTIYSAHQDFETESQNQTINELSTANKFEEIAAEGFSYTIRYPLDSLWKNTDATIVNIKAACAVRFPHQQSKGVMTLAIKGETELYEPQYLDFEGDDDWQYRTMTISISREKYQSGELTYYIWNNGTKPLQIDDLRFSILQSL